MKAAMGNKHQVVIKIVKHLDEMMVRDPNEIEEEEALLMMGQDDELDIPIPSC